MLRRTLARWALALALLAPAAAVRAEVVRVVIDRREEVLDGRAWGKVGAYEKLVGRIYFAFDPDNPENRRIVDLGLAPRNADGKVEAWAEFVVLRPKNEDQARGVAWLEVSNRGGKASLRYFNGASTGALDPTTAEDYGDGLLFRQGLTLIWVGWQWDVPDREGFVRLHVPFARNPDGPITGLVRADWTVDDAVDVLDVAHRGHRAYPVSDPADSANVLTVRDGREAPRRVIPRERWHFVPADDGQDIGRLTHIALDGGFEAGKIYELVYRAQDPRVVGLGLAAIRDVASYAKYSLHSEFPASRVIAFGVSQTGRFLRHYLYQGFNTDEGNRKALDGMFIHSAGAGRGSFNHRFGQPSRDAHRYSAFFYPTDLFPFTSLPQTDPVTGKEDGLLAHTRPEDLPLVFYTNSGYEYWGRAGSLIHTTPDGTGDVPPLPNERIYQLASGQHFVGSFPPSPESETAPGVFRGDPLDYFPILRALAVRLVAWVADDEDPPPSAYPTIAEGTLVPPEALAFPPIPGAQPPRVIHVAYRADYGPRFEDRGIVDLQPPQLGPPFPSLVSQVDGLGNEEGGVRGVEVRVPVATYAPWNLRTGAPGGTGELTDFLGTFIPLARDEAEREARHDPRPSIASLYAGRDAYLARVRQASNDLAIDGFLLTEDLDAVVARAAALWDWATRPRDQGDRRPPDRPTAGRGS
jgi:hypothetical protein